MKDTQPEKMEYKTVKDVIAKIEVLTEILFNPIFETKFFCRITSPIKLVISKEIFSEFIEL